jgi:hypothetical protein
MGFGSLVTNSAFPRSSHSSEKGSRKMLGMRRKKTPPSSLSAKKLKEDVAVFTEQP